MLAFGERERRCGSSVSVSNGSRTRRAGAGASYLQRSGRATTEDSHFFSFYLNPAVEWHCESLQGCAVSPPLLKVRCPHRAWWLGAGVAFFRSLLGMRSLCLLRRDVVNRRSYLHRHARLALSAGLGPGCYRTGFRVLLCNRKYDQSSLFLRLHRRVNLFLPRGRSPKRVLPRRVDSHVGGRHLGLRLF